MIFRTSHQSYRLVGSLDEGEELVAGLTEVCKQHGIVAGEIRAVGTLQEIELAHFNANSREYETIFQGAGAFDIVSLHGNISTLGDAPVLRLETLLSVAGPLGAQVISGQLRSGRAVACEFVIDVFEDIRLQRRLSTETGMLVLDAIERREVATPEAAAPRAPAAAAAPVAAPATPSPAPSEPERTMSWSHAIKKSQEQPSATAAAKSGAAERKAAARPDEVFADVDMETPLMKPGDILDHPKLGRCRVMKVEDDEYAHIRLPRGQIRKLSLQIVDAEYEGQENGRNVFKARVRR